MSYEPSLLPISNDVAALAAYVLDELRHVGESLEEVVSIRLVTLHAEPIRPRDGMVVLADGTDWNPGSGAGFYGRSAGAWVFLG